MTHEEFRFLAVQEFGSQKTAEVAAMYEHFLNCQGCEDWLHETNFGGQLTPDELDSIQRLCTDPEALAMIIKAYRRRLKEEQDVEKAE